MGRLKRQVASEPVSHRFFGGVKRNRIKFRRRDRSSRSRKSQLAGEAQLALKEFIPRTFYRLRPRSAKAASPEKSKLVGSGTLQALEWDKISESESALLKVVTREIVPIIPSFPPSATFPKCPGPVGISKVAPAMESVAAPLMNRSIVPVA